MSCLGCDDHQYESASKKLKKNTAVSEPKVKPEEPVVRYSEQLYQSLLEEHHLLGLGLSIEDKDPLQLENNELDQFKVNLPENVSIKSEVCSNPDELLLVDHTSDIETPVEPELIKIEFVDDGYGDGNAEFGDKATDPEVKFEDFATASINLPAHFKDVPSYVSYLSELAQLSPRILNLCEKTIGNLLYTKGIQGPQHLQLKTIMVLLHLRLGFSFEALALMMGFPQEELKKLFFNSLDIITESLKPLVCWFNLENIGKFRDSCFSLPKYKNLHIILHELNFKVKTCDDPKCHLKICADLKMAKNIKVLVGLSPVGTFNYISDVYDSKISDTEVFKMENLFDKLAPKAVTIIMTKTFKFWEPGVTMLCLYRTSEKIQEFVKGSFNRLKKFAVLNTDEIHLHMVSHLGNLLIVCCSILNLEQELNSSTEKVTQWITQVQK